MLKTNPHPYRMWIGFEGLSHGLKTCHRHVFLTAFRVPRGIKKADTQKGIGFLGGSPGTRTLDPRLKRALLYQLS